MLMCVTALWDAAGAFAGPSTLAEVIDAVRRQEELAGEYEFQWEESNRLMRPPKRPTDDPVFATMRRVSRSVWQNGKFHAELLQEGTSVAGRFSRIRNFTAYDGKMTRSVTIYPEGNAVANLHHERVLKGGIVRPHTVLLQPTAFVGPMLFSEYLAARQYREWQIEILLEGEEAVNEQHCVRIRAETWRGQRYGCYRYLWLAPERSWLPIKSVCYNGRFNPNIVLERSDVTEMKEVAPGIWFPTRVELKCGDELSALEGKEVLSNQSEFVATTARLSPDYPEELFEKIDYPPGTLFYELEAGEVVNSKMIPRLTPTQSFWRQRWFWAALLVVLGLAVGMRWWRRRA
jgi:hypothetical protein